MKHTVTVFLLVVVICKCHGQHSILGNILSTAHERVEGVADAILGGLFGKNRGNRLHDIPQKGPEETIIVVVEESDQNDYGNRPNGPPAPPPHHRRPPFDNGPPEPPPPHHHHHHHQRPPFDHDLPQSHHPYQQPHDDRPGYNDPNQSLHQHHEHLNNQDWDNQEKYNNFHGNRQNGQPYNNNNGNYNINSNPTTEYIKTPSTNARPLPNDEDNKVTKTPSDDKPLFIPLNPNENVYGDDKVNITAPKRDTDKTKTEESDDFEIDIRLKNE